MLDGRLGKILKEKKKRENSALDYSLRYDDFQNFFMKYKIYINQNIIKCIWHIVV